jgi:CheY-like chemotaxis protein
VASVVALVSDLIFVSRIREAARKVGAEVRTVRAPQALLEACRAERPGLVIADLDDPRLQALPAIATLRADPAGNDLPIVGFISHVDGVGAQAATRAGFTRVLARSAFVAELPGMLARS